VKTATRFLLTFYLLLATSQRLPAPISEEANPTPKPQPKREATPRPKPKPAAIPKPTPNRSFAGNWSGSVIASASDGSENSSANYIIRISDDEKTVWINWGEVGQDNSGAGYQVPCTRFRGALTWSLTLLDRLITDTLLINTNGTGSFASEGRWVSGDNAGITYKHSGILSRQGASSGPSGPQTAMTSTSQTTAAAAPKSVGGLPVASPVPNKPGFVYNPYDPNSKVLLDVRGKAAGTKLKDPFSGKLFITP